MEGLKERKQLGLVAEISVEVTTISGVVSTVVASLSLSISSDGATVTVAVSMSVSMTVVSTVVACLSLSISGNGASVAVAVPMSVSMTIVSSIVTVYASVDLLIGHFSHFGLLGDGRSQQNSQNDQKFHFRSRVDIVFASG